MSLSVLSQASALNPGAELWILPALEQSQWTARIDWYLNFQISKALRHQKAQTPDFIQEVQEATELPPVDLSYVDSNLMIASSHHLPNKWVVVLPWNDNLESWSEEVAKVWNSLQKPSLRIFFPPKQSTGQFQMAWKNQSDFEDFTVVLD